MAIARQIVGPQEQYERSGAQSLRDIRPLTTRLSEGLRSSASGLVLGVAAAATFLEPAIVDVAVPASALYALWVLTRRVKLPMRLPCSAACPDYSNPMPGSRKPKPANGTLFIGFSAEQFRLESMLKQMAGIGGPRDALTLYTEPLTGAYYFIPSVQALRRFAPSD